MSTITPVISYRDWQVPMDRDEITLRAANNELARVKARQYEIPLMVQLVENPKFHLPGFRLFHGAVDLRQHDFIHIVLGRGLLPMDEAFTIGFTMGTTNKVTTTEEKLYSLISKYFYPKVYKFDDCDIAIFKDAVRLGYISNCVALDEFDFSPYMETRLRDLREILRLEKDLLVAYYKIEKQRYPDSKASQRLIG